MNTPTPMINCKLAAGASICAVCGSMVPDYCLKREEPEVRETMGTGFWPWPLPFKDLHGIVTGSPAEVAETLPEPPAPEVPEVVAEPVVEAPPRAKRGPKKRKP